jgi:hypothetical protein
MDKQMVLETIDAALKAVITLRQSIDEDKSLIADVQSRALLKEVKRLLETLKAEKENSFE